MVGDWIKMRTDLYRDPKVCAMADILMGRDSELSRYVNQMKKCDMSVTRNVTRCAVVGALVSVWGVLRHQGRRDGDDLVIDGVTNAVVDDIADLPGFGDVMEHVGWLESDDDGIVLPKFFRELNAEPIRSTAAERQKKYRERKREGVTGDVTRDVTRDTGGDVTEPVTVTGEKRERREENNTPLPPTGGEVVSDKVSSKFDPSAVDLPHPSPAFRSAWADWVRHRAEKRERLTPTTTTKQLKALSGLSESDAIACIERSVTNGWTGLFPDKVKTTAPPPVPPIPPPLPNLDYYGPNPRTQAAYEARMIAKQQQEAASEAGNG